MSRNRSLAPYVSSPEAVVRKMLDMAHVKPGEKVYDLGSGDGRIPIIAAEEFGAHGVGVDLNERFIKEARGKVKEKNLQDKVEFINSDIFDVDLSDADVITMYLTTSANEKVRPKLEEELKKGARVVTHDFSMRKWNFGESVRFKEGYRSHTIYIYEWPPES
jgi:cyclopropane fatty-acyl-phospholipid synthase-like methyltransferase